MTELNLLLSTFILAGGKSTRMGQDKALMTIQGTPLLKRTCEIALALTPQVYIITPWINRYAEIVPSQCQFILEPEPPQAPLIGFSLGLAQIQTPWILLLACDLPKLRLETLQTWAKTLTELPSKIDIYISRNPKGWEPLCGFYRQRTLGSLQAYLQKGERSFQTWLDTQTIQELPLENQDIFFNCNTPEDWIKLQESLETD